LARISAPELDVIQEIMLARCFNNTKKIFFGKEPYLNQSSTKPEATPKW